VGKVIKYHFTITARGDAAVKGTFASVSNLKYFIQAVKLWWPPQNYLLYPLIFRQSAFALYKLGVSPPPTDLEYAVRQVQAKQKVLKFNAIYSVLSIT